ncbi:MAG: C1 family peptidase [Burkholderiales bacterium]|nr:C1 family peptidase [Burkholderiales bacterium]
MPSRQVNLTHAGLRTLDARPDRLDLRDRPYLPPVRSLPHRYPSDANLRKLLPDYLKKKMVLDQGQEGACTGFGLAAAINFMLWYRHVETKGRYPYKRVSPYMLYDLARFYDEWPGEDYDGSSCRGAMKGWHKHGVCEYSHWTSSVKPGGTSGKSSKPYKPNTGWAFDAANCPVGIYYRVNRESVTDIQAAINEMGAVYVAATVHAGWDSVKLANARLKSHDDIPVIPWTKDYQATGGHAFALMGFNESGFVVQNSWGDRWGNQGFAVITYADWVANGCDAWVCSLGVPQVKPGSAANAATVSRVRQLNSSAVTPAAALASTAPSAAEPWDVDTAYAHTLVAGNNGVVRHNTPDIGSAAAQVEKILVDAPLAWARETKLAKSGKPLKLMLYAHGGLNSEDSSVKRIRKLGPYFLANGVYPVFYTWRTGFMEVVKSALGDAFAPSEAPASGKLADAKDALIEAICHGTRAIWNEMTENAARGADAGHAIDLAAEAIVMLASKVDLEVHLVGHSAGSFVHGHLMDALAKRKLPVHSLTLYAPACSLDFANEHFVPAVQKKRLAKDAFWLHVLSDKRERADFVGPGTTRVYGKSLLYLVSRGFESTRKTPLAGLEHCLDTRADNPDDDLWTKALYEKDVLAWRKFVATLPAQADGRAAVEVTDADVVTEKLNADGTMSTTKASHGSFDNDVDVVTRTINRVLGVAPGAKLAVPVVDLKY